MNYAVALERIKNGKAEVQYTCWKCALFFTETYTTVFKCDASQRKNKYQRPHWFPLWKVYLTGWWNNWNSWYTGASWKMDGSECVCLFFKGGDGPTSE